MDRHPQDVDEPAAAPSVPPGYPLADRLVVTRAEQVRALAHPLRTTVLGLLTEREASVAELATATGRPKGTVAHHVGRAPPGRAGPGRAHPPGPGRGGAVLRPSGPHRHDRGRRARGPPHRPERLRRRGRRSPPARRSSACCGRSSGTRGSTPPGPVSSGPGSVTSSRSSTACRAAATPPTAWPSASTRSRATPGCRNARRTRRRAARRRVPSRADARGRRLLAGPEQVDTRAREGPGRAPS